MAKPNEINKWAVGMEPEQLWTVVAGAEVESFCMVKPEIWVHVTQSLGVSELTYCGVIVVCRTCT